MNISTRLNFIILILMVIIGILSLTDRKVDSGMHKANKAVKAIPECLVTDKGIISTHGAICPEVVQ